MYIRGLIPRNSTEFIEAVPIEYILNKSEKATVQLSLVCEKVLDKMYLLKLHNVSQTSSKRFVETPPMCLV